MELVVQLSALLTLLSKGEQMSRPQKIFYSLLTERKSDIRFFWVEWGEHHKIWWSSSWRCGPCKGNFGDEPGNIMHREISCFCNGPHICQCHYTTMVNLQTAGIQASAQDDDLNGKFILVKYEGRPFVGQVLQVIGDEIEVNCMQQLGRKNVFIWPSWYNFLLYKGCAQSDIRTRAS